MFEHIVDNQNYYGVKCPSNLKDQHHLKFKTSDTIGQKWLHCFRDEGLCVSRKEVKYVTTFSQQMHYAPIKGNIEA